MAGMLLLAGLATSPARGSAIIPPRDLGDLARVSEAVVLARAGSSFTLARGGMIYTHTAFEVLDVVNGAVPHGGSLVVETSGGVLDGQGWVFAGTPRFAEETVYLLFLNRRGAVWQPRMLAYGLLERTRAADGSVVLNHIQEHHDLELLPRPDGVVPEPLGAYYETPLLNHLRQVTTEGRTWNRVRVEVPAALRPRAHHDASKTNLIPQPCVYLSYESTPIRWNAFEEQRIVEVFAEENGDDGVDDGSEFDAVQNGIAAWQDVPGVDIDYRWAGTAPYTPDCSDGTAAPGDVAADQGLVQYNDPCKQMPELSGCSGVLALGGSFFQIDEDGRHVHRDIEWNTSVIGYVVVNNGVGACLSAAQYRIMMTHELGHTLGFDHIPFGAGLSNMNPTCCVEITEIDELCALYAYSDGPLPGAPGPVTLIAPQDRALGLPTTVEFIWHADSTSNRYHLQISADEAFTQLIYEDDALEETTHRVTLADGEAYFWRVRGRNGIGEGPWSEVYRFRTEVERIPPDTVILAMPADSTINQPTTLTLVWNDAERATFYHVQVSPDSAFAEILFEDDALMQTMQDVGPLDNLTVYFWRVRARNGAGQTRWSAVWRFKTLPPLPGPTEPIAPVQDAVDVSPTPTLSWQPVAFRETYHLQIATTFNFSRIVFETDTLTTTTYRAGPLENKRKYFWRVRALNAAGGGPWIGRQRFTTGTLPAAVALVAPHDGSVDQPSTIRFEWQPTDNAFTYHLQVSTDSTFAQLVYENDALTQTMLEVGPLEYLTMHFWRVRGIGVAGEGAWSAVRRFTVAIGTAAERLGEALPERYALHSNYPNPFNPRTTLRFDLPEAGPVSLVIYDVLGRTVETLVAGALPPGRYSFVWEAADKPSGVYLARLQAGSFRQTQQLLLVK